MILWGFSSWCVTLFVCTYVRMCVRALKQLSKHCIGKPRNGEVKRYYKIDAVYLTSASSQVTWIRNKTIFAFIISGPCQDWRTRTLVNGRNQHQKSKYPLAQFVSCTTTTIHIKFNKIRVDDWEVAWLNIILIVLWAQKASKLARARTLKLFDRHSKRDSLSVHSSIHEIGCCCFFYVLYTFNSAASYIKDHIRILVRNDRYKMWYYEWNIQFFFVWF